MLEKRPIFENFVFLLHFLAEGQKRLIRYVSYAHILGTFY